MGCESRNNHRYAVVVQDFATQWIQSYPVQNKNFSGKHKGACKSSGSRIGILKSFTLTIPWNSAKLVKISPGIIARRHHTDRKQLHTKGVLENHLKDRSFRSVHWLSITLLLRKTSQKSINLERKSYLDCSSDTLCPRGEFGRGDIFGCRH